MARFQKVRVLKLKQSGASVVLDVSIPPDEVEMPGWARNLMTDDRLLVLNMDESCAIRYDWMGTRCVISTVSAQILDEDYASRDGYAVPSSFDTEFWDFHSRNYPHQPPKLTAQLTTSNSHDQFFKNRASCLDSPGT